VSMQDNVNALDSNCASPPKFQSSTVHQINAPYSRQRQAVACSGKIRLKRNTAAVITTNFMLLQSSTAPPRHESIRGLDEMWLGVNVV